MDRKRTITNINSAVGTFKGLHSVGVAEEEGGRVPSFPQPTSSPERKDRQPAMDKTILIVDDEAQFRRALRAALRSCGYAIVDVASGEEALENMEATTPDLILLDMNMPGLTGVETCRAIRAFSGVPILILSVRSTEKDRSDALQAGANDYLTKPFSLRDLLLRIQSALQG
jgi:CheY-like chemotaxis protein